MFQPTACFAYANVAPPLPRRAASNRFANALFRRTARFADRWGDAPEPAPVDDYPPLTEKERLLYIGFACWAGFTFFALFALIIFMHTPGNAN